MPPGLAHGRLDDEHRAAILTPLAAAPFCTRAAAQSAAEKLGISQRQVFALIRRLRKANCDPSALQSGKSAGGRGRSRIAPTTDQTLRRIIEEIGDAITDLPLAYALARVKQKCAEHQVTPPSDSTLRRRLKARACPLGWAPAANNHNATTVSIHGAGRNPGAETESNLLAKLYDTVGNEAAWSTFLTELTKASCSFDRAVMVWHDNGLKGGHFGAYANLEPAVVDKYARYYASLNPWLRQPEKLPVGVAVPSGTFVPHADLLKTEFYNDFCRPLDVDAAIGLTVQQDGARSIVVGLQGREKNLDRERHVVAQFQYLAPHVLRVAQITRQFAMLDARTTSAEAALDALGNALLIVNSDRQLLHLNATAERLIADADGLTVRRKTLVADLPAETQALQHLITTALQARHTLAASPGGVMRITRRSGRTSYEVLVTPLAGAMVGLGLNGPLAAVFVRDPHRQLQTPSSRLQHLYALTDAEARLMSALLAGRTIREITELFRVSRETLRSQLKAVFAKTGCTSQIELIRLGLRGIAAMG